MLVEFSCEEKDCPILLESEVLSFLFLHADVAPTARHAQSIINKAFVFFIMTPPSVFMLYYNIINPTLSILLCKNAGEQSSPYYFIWCSSTAYYNHLRIKPPASPQRKNGAITLRFLFIQTPQNSVPAHRNLGAAAVKWGYHVRVYRFFATVENPRLPR